MHMQFHMYDMLAATCFSWLDLRTFCSAQLCIALQQMQSIQALQWTAMDLSAIYKIQLGLMNFLHLFAYLLQQLLLLWVAGKLKPLKMAVPYMEKFL